MRGGGNVAGEVLQRGGEKNDSGAGMAVAMRTSVDGRNKGV